MYSAPGLPLGPKATFEWVPFEERVGGPRRYVRFIVPIRFSVTTRISALSVLQIHGLTNVFSSLGSNWQLLV